MAKNEAKIRFTAETGGFNSEIKKSNEEMSRLRAEMKLNDAQMKTTGASVEALENKHQILSAQLAVSESKTQALSQKVDKAAEIFGENSTEVNKLRTQLLNAQTAEEKIRQAINTCNNELDAQRKAEEKTETATEKLTRTIDDQQSELDKLKKEYVDTALQHGKNSKEAKDLAKQIDNLSGELEDNKRDLNNAEEAADKFDNSLDNAGDSADGFGGKMTGVAVGVAAAAAALVEFGKSAMEAFNEVDEGADNVIKATGATGEQAEALEESYSNVAKKVVGDFGEIGSALGEVNTRFGYTGKELEDASIKFQKFSEITGVDSTEAVQSVSRALNDAGIPLSEYDTLLDQLAKAGQSAGIDVTALADSLSENGSIMRSMGFDTQETIALLSQFELSGANTSVMLTGMKKAMATWTDAGKDGSAEFAKMVEGIQNGSVSASDAIDVFGTKAGPMLVDAIKSGKFEYQDMLTTIQNSKGTVESTFDGTVDGGYEMELAMQNCKMALAEVGEVVGTAMTPVFQALSENIIPALVDGFGSLVEGVQSAVSWMNEHKTLMTVIASVVGVLVTAITAYNVVQGIKTAMDAANVTTVWGLVAAHIAQAAAAMAAIAPYVLIVAAIAAVIAIIVLCVKYWDEIVAAVKKCWQAVCDTLSGWGEWINTNVIQPIVGFFTGLWDGIVGIFQSVIDWVKNNWKSIVLFLINPFAGVFNYLYENFEGFRNFIDNIVQNIKQFFVDLWDGIKAVWDGICNAVQVAIMFIGSIISAAFDIITLPFRFIWENCKQYVFAAWEWIKNAVSTAINAVKGVITTVMNAIQTFFINVWNGIKSIFTTVWNAIVGFLTPIINGIKNTISTVFNSVKNTISTIFNTVKNVVTTVWNSIKTAVTTVVNAIKNTISTVFNAIKNTVSTVFNAVKNTATNVWNGIKTAISNVVNGIKNTVSNIFNSVKSKVSSVFNGIKSTATNVWNGIKNAITKPIEAARDKIKGIIDKIKGFFSNLKLKFPNIKMPHFKITGKFSLDPPSVPKLGIEWYKDGGIMMKPTIFGMNGNSLMAGGEAGPEAILPIDRLEGYISGAIEKAQNVVNLQSLADAIEDLANRPIQMNINGRQFATATANDSDGVNGLRTTFKNRGLALG